MIQAVAWSLYGSSLALSLVSSWILFGGGFGGRSRFGVAALRSLPDDLRGLALDDSRRGLCSRFALDDLRGLALGLLSMIQAVAWSLAP